MKVTLLVSRLNKMGGLEKTTLRLAKSFAKQGCRTTILTTGVSLHEPGIEIVSLHSKKKLSFLHLLAFDSECKKYLKSNPSEIVFGMERNSIGTHYRAGSGIHAAFLQRRKVIDSPWKRFEIPFNPLHRTLLQLEKKCFESATMETIFTNSNMVKRELLEFYNTPSEKIEVVHNGGPLLEWKEAFEKTFQEKISQPFQFLFVGSGFRRKGLHFLLSALSLLSPQDFQLTVVGGDKDMNSFKELTTKLNLEKKVIFLGPQKELSRFYQKADCLVIPSIYDPFAGVTMEGLAMGLFVVSSKYNGGCEVITEENGIVIDPSDIQELANGLTVALSRPKTPLIAEKIRKTIEKLDYSTQCDKIVQKTLSFR